MTQVKYLQFPRYFLQHEAKLNSEIIQKLLEIEVQIHHIGEPDTVTVKNNTIIISQPSSLARFLYIILYTLLKKYITPGFQQDKLSLGLLHVCKEYAYADYDINQKSNKIPTLISFKKLHLPHLILQELIEPIAGKTKFLPVVNLASNFTDACEVINSQEKFDKKYKFPNKNKFSGYPILVLNNSLYNSAARMAHVTTTMIEYSFGEEPARNIIKNIILAKNGDLEANLVSLVKILEGNPIFILDFLKYFESNITLTADEGMQAFDIRQNIIANDQYLKKNIKIAQKHTPNVFRQWEQWSLIVGLIEKQLAPMRGSMWPTTENLGPYEDEKRSLIVEEAKKKGKTQLNFEEMLELARSWYNHKAVQPGNLYEKLLRENRVWKT